MRKIRNTEERFKEKVKVVNSGCHEWQSTLHRDGYGKFWLSGAQIQAHRVGYMLANGEIPEGKMILHKCDNRKCVNPDHLYAGTASDNCKDKVARFKGLWGKMEFSHETVSEVKSLRQQGLTQTKIADITGMHQTHVSRILRNVSRKFN